MHMWFISVKRNIARLVPSMKNASAAARVVMAPAVRGRRRAVHRRLRRLRVRTALRSALLRFQRLVVRVAGRRVRRDTA